MNIENYVPVGQKNAISREQLRIRSGLKDREMREEIMQARERGSLIINLQDGAGYFIPAAEENKLIERFLYQETRRALTKMKNLQPFVKYLKREGC